MAQLAQENRVALVTGGNRGIGLTICQKLAKLGLIVYGTYRSQKPDEDDEKNQNIKWLKMDVVKYDQVKAAIETIIKNEKKLDIVVNNSGVTMGMCPIENAPIEKMREVMDINYFGVINVIKNIVPHMREKKSGLIINISSCISMVSLPFLSPYCASKAALDRLSEGAYHELKGFGIKVVIVSPGPVHTEFDKEIGSLVKQADKSYSETLEIFGENSRNIVKSGIEPDDVADCVVKIVEGKEKDYRVYPHPKSEGFAKGLNQNFNINYSHNIAFGARVLQKAVPPQQQQQQK